MSLPNANTLNLFDSPTMGSGYTRDITLNGAIESNSTYTWYCNNVQITPTNDRLYTINPDKLSNFDYRGGTYKVEVTTPHGIKTYPTINVSIDYQNMANHGSNASLNAQQLRNLANRVNNQGITFGIEGGYTTQATITQQAEIDLSYYTGTWDPIGNFSENESLCFNGIYDGHNNIITNLTIDDTSKTYQGIFGKITNTVQNINLNNININAGDQSGTLVGLIQNGNINNIYLNSGIVKGIGTLGGLVGNVLNGKIEYSGVDSANMDGIGNLGGVVGNASNSEINRCYIKENVSISSEGWKAAGICALASESSIISESRAAGNIYLKAGITGSLGNTSAYSSASGILGSGLNASEVKYCYNNANVIMDVANGIHNCRASGIADESKLISYCYNTGTIKITGEISGGGDVVAGISGQNWCTIQNCYNVGELIFDLPIPGNGPGEVFRYGGICGYNASYEIKDCYYLDTSVSYDRPGIGDNEVEGITNVEKKSSIYMRSTEFINILGSDKFKFILGKNNGYPALYWENGTSINKLEKINVGYDEIELIIRANNGWAEVYKGNYIETPTTLLNNTTYLVEYDGYCRDGNKISTYFSNTGLGECEPIIESNKDTYVYWKVTVNTTCSGQVLYINDKYGPYGTSDTIIKNITLYKIN